MGIAMDSKAMRQHYRRRRVRGEGQTAARSGRLRTWAQRRQDQARVVPRIQDDVLEELGEKFGGVADEGLAARRQGKEPGKQRYEIVQSCLACHLDDIVQALTWCT